MHKLSAHESPMICSISFHKLLEQYDAMTQSETPGLAERAKRILKSQEPYPFFRDGFTDVSVLEKHEDVVKLLLQDCFSEVLTHNEIKAASIPFNDFVFNRSKRFEKILEHAGADFELKIRNMPDHMHYLIAATVILKAHYGAKADFKRPLFFDIPDANGVMRHYRIMYNADFMEMIPTDKAKDLSEIDIQELLENYDDLALWREKIPPNSFIAKGFVICNMFDVTADHAISEIKSKLISNSEKNGSDDHVEDMNRVFRSFFELPDLQVGYILYNNEEQVFEKVGMGKKKSMQSFLMATDERMDCQDSFCQHSRKKLLENGEYFVVSNLDLVPDPNPFPIYENLKSKGVKSAIMAPISGEDGQLLGLLELVSGVPNVLNSVNAQKLNDIMPFIISTVQRSIIEEENLIDAVIQHECTSVHPSVHWKFKKEAKRFIMSQIDGDEPQFSEMVFESVYPLYGQIDIKDSSKLRNAGIQKDLIIQLTEIGSVLRKVWDETQLPVYEELLYRVFNHIEEIKEVLYTSSEQTIFDFITDEVNPVLDYLKKDNSKFRDLIVDYEAHIDATTGMYYDHRRNYDESVTMINMKMAGIMDKRQVAAQEMFPHYFERYKTDGVEHNMFIGATISQSKAFNPLFLNNLRLWQLQVMCEMENAHYNLKNQLAVPLDVASLILVYSTPLSIRFRMDEKQFDVDGTYNARYEVIKKRIDKSYVKGTNERLTQKGKLAIVYSQKKDETEYLRYIRFLMAKGYFTNQVEILELDGLQGVSGLKAIRVEILYKTDKDSEKTYTYEDLMKALEE